MLQKPRAHTFRIYDKIVRIIDTPGIGDTRGVEQDKKNINSILTYIARYDEIHAICIMMRPDNNRGVEMFGFCVNELLRQLHVSASRADSTGSNSQRNDL